VTVEGVVTSLALRHPAGHLAARLPPGSSRRRLRGSGRRPPDPTPFRRRTTSAATLDLGRGRRKKPRAKHGPQTKAVWIRLPSPAPYAKSTAIWASDPYSRKVRQRPQHQPSIRPTRCADRAFSDTRRRLGREFASRRSGVRFPVSPPRSEALSARRRGSLSGPYSGLGPAFTPDPRERSDLFGRCYRCGDLVSPSRPPRACARMGWLSAAPVRRSRLLAATGVGKAFVCPATSAPSIFLPWRPSCRAAGPGRRWT